MLAIQSPSIKIAIYYAFESFLLSYYIKNPVSELSASRRLKVHLNFLMTPQNPNLCIYASAPASTYVGYEVQQGLLFVLGVG